MTKRTPWNMKSSNGSQWRTVYEYTREEAEKFMCSQPVAPINDHLSVTEAVREVMMGKLVTCKRCGWVHCAMSLDQVERDVHQFNTFYDAAPPSVKECYSQSSSVDDYKHCDGCGGSYKNFREYREGDCPDGCTIGPILES